MSDFQDCKDEVGSYTIDGVEYALTQLPKLIVLGKDNVLFVATAFTESMQDGDGKFAATNRKDFVELNWDCTEWYNDVDAQFNSTNGPVIGKLKCSSARRPGVRIKKILRR